MRPTLTLVRLLRALVGDRRGATAVEYGFLISLIVLALFLGLQRFAETTIAIWTRVADVVVSHNPNV